MDQLNIHKHFTYKDFIIPMVLSVIVAITSQYNFLLFHSLAEFFAIAIAILVSIVAWNMFPFTRNHYLLFLGCAYFWIGVLDLLHTFAYKGMHIFPTDSSNTAVQFWIATRYIEAFSLLLAPLFLKKSLNRVWTISIFGLIATAATLAITNGIFPTGYIEGKGLTDFKIYSEYLIILVLLLAIAHLRSNKHLLDRRIMRLLTASIALTMFAEFSFTFYISVYDAGNIIGHIFKLFSYWLIFLAVIRTTLQEPFIALSRDSSTYDAIPDAIVVISPQGEIQQANKSAVELAKLPASELIGKSSYDIFHSCRCDKKECPVFNDEPLDSFSCERQVTLGGEDKWLSFSYSPIGSETSSRGRVEVIRDISSRKMAEHQYERVNALKNSIVANLPMMLFVKDAKDLKYLEWNKKAEELTGIAKQEMLGKDDYNFWPEDEVEFFIEKDREVLREHKLLDIPQEPLSTKLGIRTLHTTKIPIYDNQGEPQYLLGLSEDITERLQTEQALRQSQKMDAIGKLTGGIAHDFNNMLGVVMGFTELMLMQSQGDPKLQEYANEVLRAGQRGTKLTNKLLAFTRDKPLDESQANINEVLLGQQHLLEKTLTVRISLKYDLAENTWPILVSCNDLEDAVLNVAINAMHAMSGGGAFNISTENIQLDPISSKELDVTPDEYVKLSLSDTGFGMDEKTCSQIFDPFFTTKGDLGTGLGLSQVYGFIRRSRGGIKVVSSPGEGSRFELYFPRLLVNERQDNTDMKTQPIEYDGKESVLVVDDEPALRMLMQAMLTEAGYQASVAEDGEQALEILSKETFDLLVSDVIMPKIDGFQLAGKAQDLYPQMKIQLVSGYNDNIENTHVDKNLKEQSLHKPFSREVFLSRIRHRLDAPQNNKS